MREALLPVVRHTVAWRVAKSKTSRWAYTIVLEFALLAGDQATTQSARKTAFSALHDLWQAETALNMLRPLIAAREQRHSVGAAVVVDGESLQKVASLHSER